MSVRVQHRLFPGFAGVALADILANGVAIIILMIVITVMIKHEQEEQRLEQVEDVSVLLSRDLATSVVMNALPTSPPARLHDYQTSPLDRNPTHAIMPIIELHADYIRNYYTGETISRDELLRHDNAFDRYIKSLTPAQLSRVRIDIYSIRLFYVVMSIFRDYNARPGHWHFLSYAEGGDGVGEHGDKWTENTRDKLFRRDEESRRAPGEGDTEGNEESRNAAAATATSEKAPGRRNPGVPRETALDSNPGGLKNYPYDDLAFEQGGAQRQEAPEDLPGSISEPRGQREKTSDDFFSALAQMMMEGATGEGRLQARISRFRSARGGETRMENGTAPGGEEDTASSTPADLRLLLPALFEFMRRVQDEADAGGATRLAEYNFKRDVLPLMAQARHFPANQKLKPLFDRLVELISDSPEEDADEPIPMTQNTNERLRSNVLAVQINERVRTAQLVGNGAQERRPDLPGEMRPTLHFGLYPAIYRGLRAPLKKNSLILMPPEQKAPHEFRWRVMTMVSPTADDFMTSFVHAALDERGNLLISSEENALNVAGYRVATNYPTLPFRNERWLLLIYGAAAGLIALGVLRRARKAT